MLILKFVPTVRRPHETVILSAILENVRTPDPRLGRATARALARFARPAARSGLLHLLAHRDPSVVDAAIDGLRTIGTIEEVEHLAAVGAGFFGDRVLRRAARAAIEAIQLRTLGPAPGALSLAPVSEQTGALSCAA